MNQHTNRYCTQRDHLPEEPRIRRSKRRRIADLFTENIGKRFNSRLLHIEFGSGLRARISELNNDPTCPVRILNRTVSSDTEELSFYWSEPREAAPSLFGDMRPDRTYRE